MNPTSVETNGTRRVCACLLVAGLLTAVTAQRGFAQSPMDDIAIGRSMLKAERTAAVAAAMQLTEEEGKVFWPLYREYWVAMDGVNNGLVNLMVAYAEALPNVPEARAVQLLKDYTDLEKKHLDVRVDYLKQFAKTLSAAQALRVAQVENRLEIELRQQLAGVIPLVPAESE